MEAILVDPPLSGHSSFDLEHQGAQKGHSIPSLEGGRDDASTSSILGRTVGLFKGSKIRKNYSLAPCCHLFVRVCRDVTSGVD